MTLLEATATLIDCARTFAPENDRKVRQAVARMEKRLRLLQVRMAKVRRRNRGHAWATVQDFTPQCEKCSYQFTFTDVVRSADIDGRGYIRCFNCPNCHTSVVQLEARGPIPGSTRTVMRYVFFGHR